MSPFDSCPWDIDTEPVIFCTLEGMRDDPTVVIKVRCPKCNITRNYCPTEEEIHKHYKTRYSENKQLIGAVLPKLLLTWNWKDKQS